MHLIVCLVCEACMRYCNPCTPPGAAIPFCSCMYKQSNMLHCIDWQCMLTWAVCRTLPIGWIRVGGVLASLYGFYYLGAGYADRQHQHASQGFYRATVLGRLFLFVMFSIIVWRKEVERTLLIPAVINLLGAVTMHVALLRQQHRTS